MVDKQAKAYNARFCSHYDCKFAPSRIGTGYSKVTEDFLSMPLNHQAKFAASDVTFVEYY
jgi:hypothetical protein